MKSGNGYSIFTNEMAYFTETKLDIKLRNDTLSRYDRIIAECREIFRNKTHDYGTAWRVLRPSSLTDQIYIKARRIKTIEEKGTQKVGDTIADEFKGIINYSLIALIQLELSGDVEENLSEEDALKLFDKKAGETRQLMLEKNHDYGEAWRDMRHTSFTDMVMMKLMRLRQIEDNNGMTRISEGADSHYKDIINYSVFALIKLSEQKQNA
ncbi:MAG TPA: DUF1599 domain-containing protein [Chitinophagales bacterium]|nr:DUF1599 domain-containing protein [Chitinophagales bacterium]